MRGVLLVNMGGPECEEEMRSFLYRMFADASILPLPWGLRQFVAGKIADKRWRTSWGMYPKEGSPVRCFTFAKAKALREMLDSVPVEAAFSYSEPSVAEGIQLLVDQGVRDLLVIPLYPHESSCTTGSVWRDIKRSGVLKKGIEVNMIRSFHLDDRYCQWWVELIRDCMAEWSRPGILFSAHGTPQYLVRRGDPYTQHIQESAAKIAGLLGLEYRISYQSKVGPIRWTGPETPLALRQWLDEGIKHLLVVPISFVCENMETFSELDNDIIPEVLQDFPNAEVRRVKIEQPHPLFMDMLKKKVEAAFRSND